MSIAKRQRFDGGSCAQRNYEALCSDDKSDPELIALFKEIDALAAADEEARVQLEKQERLAEKLPGRPGECLRVRPTRASTNLKRDKGKSIAGSGSGPENAADRRKYNRYLNDLMEDLPKPVAEIGFHPSYVSLKQIERTVLEMGWSKLVLHCHKPWNLTVVREFYAGLHAGDGDSVRVRGCEVDVSVSGIRRFMSLPAMRVGECNYCKYTTRNLAKEQVEEALATEFSKGSAKVGSTGITIEKKHLTVTAKAWVIMISTKILPRTQSSVINNELATLAYCMVKGLVVDFPYIMKQSLVRAMTERQIWLPSFITRLCTHAGVHHLPSDVLMPPEECIDEETVANLKDEYTSLKDMYVAEEERRQAEKIREHELHRLRLENVAVKEEPQRLRTLGHGSMSGGKQNKDRCLHKKMKIVVHLMVESMKGNTKLLQDMWDGQKGFTCGRPDDYIPPDLSMFYEDGYDDSD